MSHGSIHSYPPGLVSGSGVKSCSWISSWAWMLSADQPMWSPACLPFAVPQPSPGSPRRPACAVGNGPHPHGPCRCARTGQPAPYTKGGFLPSTHQQCPIIDCPCEVLEMAGVIHIQQGQGIRHARPLHPMLLLSASQCREAQNLISYNNLLIHAPLSLYLVEDIE